jgi:hypothetical protein
MQWQEWHTGPAGLCGRMHARNQVLVLSAQWGLPMGQRGRPLQHWHSGTSSSAISDQLRDHTGKKRKYWLVLTEVMRAAPRVFVCVRWHGTCKQHLRSPLEKRKNSVPRSWWSCSAPATPASCEWELGATAQWESGCESGCGCGWPGRTPWPPRGISGEEAQARTRFSGYTLVYRGRHQVHPGARARPELRAATPEPPGRKRLLRQLDSWGSGFASRLPEVRGRACAQTASASHASCRSGPA